MKDMEDLTNSLNSRLEESNKSILEMSNNLNESQNTSNSLIQEHESTRSKTATKSIKKFDNLKNSGKSLKKMWRRKLKNPLNMKELMGN